MTATAGEIVVAHWLMGTISDTLRRKLVGIQSMPPIRHALTKRSE